jgi:DNA polymerase-3 subunit epsilon
VEATLFIWNRIIRELAERGVQTLHELEAWLAQPVIRQKERIYPMAPCERADLPAGPGVYRMLRSNGDVLYVGKATSLKSRVSSYFRKGSRHPEHILEMLTQAISLKCTETGTALEAALLETDEIKRISPPYNKSLRQRKRRILFWSDQLDDVSTTPGIHYRLGPVAADRALAAYAPLCRILDRTLAEDEENSDLDIVLGVEEAFAPDRRILFEGLSFFKSAYPEFGRSGNPLQNLVDMGRMIWLERLAEKAAKDKEPEEEEQDKEEFIWTPEAVARAFGRNMMWAAHELRRGRWLTLLSESVIAWEETANARRFVVMERGEPTMRGWVREAQDLPLPPGHNKRYEARKHNFDIVTWDRLRVLSTEIRRIVGSGTWIQVKLGPKALLDRSALERLFKWV